MSDLKKQIEDAARQYANKTQFMSNYPHDWNSAYDGYIQGAMDVLQPKQANGIDSDNANCAIFDVVGHSGQLFYQNVIHHTCKHFGITGCDGCEVKKFEAK